MNKFYSLGSDFNVAQIANDILSTPTVARDEWQSDKVSHRTYEARNVLIEYSPSSLPGQEQRTIGADMPWAEKHFQERISGQPLNPPPSAAEWPWHAAAKDLHTQDAQYSHTYPERFWPKYAGASSHYSPINVGIRYDYGDLDDVISQLKARPFTRQAYLPIFFPEDTGAPLSQRVPCTLGYHFIRNGVNLDCNYFIRSCDMTRHFRNDMYFAVRLLQHVQSKLENPMGFPMLGTVTMFISNLHIFENDAHRWGRPSYYANPPR